MQSEFEIIEMGSWLASPAGQYALAWAQDQVDRALADAFGYHALQLGLPAFDGLRANRMPHRWVVHDAPPECPPSLLTGGLSAGRQAEAPASVPAGAPGCIALHAGFDALPFPSSSIDLVLMPHTLELTHDPHATLAEVARVLVPEGRVMIIGFNPASLWGLRQWLGWGWRFGLPGDPLEGTAHVAEFLGYRRVRDWLRLLSFDIQAGRFGLWRPALSTQRGLDRLAWMDRVGSHWWPVLGGAYAIEAVKRVRGMRLVGLARRPVRRVAASPAVVAQRQREPVHHRCGPSSPR